MLQGYKLASLMTVNFAGARAHELPVGIARDEPDDASGGREKRSMSTPPIIREGLSTGYKGSRFLWKSN